ncbi:MAG: tyrosine-type recombinase/integrase [Smithella sp.]
MIKNFETYKQFLVDSGKSERTILGYLADITIFSRWFEQTHGEILCPDNLTPTDVREYKQHLLTIQKAKATTINRHLAALRSYAAWAKTNGSAVYNPADGIKGVSQQKHAPKWLDRKEQAAVLREAERRIQAAKTEPAKRQAIRDYCILGVLLNTGLRVSELVTLEIEDITFSERKGELRVRAGKGTKERIIPLNDSCRKAIKVWFSVRPAGKANRVFTTQRGFATTRAIQTVLESIGEAAHVENMTPHVARHTFAKNLINAGVSLEKVAMLLGHSSLDTTMVYTTPGMSDLDKAVRTLDG